MTLAKPDADAKPDAKPDAEAVPDANPNPEPTAKPRGKANYNIYPGSHSASLPPVLQGHYGAAGYGQAALHAGAYGQAAKHPGGYAQASSHYAQQAVYPAPEPSFKELEPLYLKEKYPKTNCTVEDEALRAEICVPDFQTKCEEASMMNKRLEMGEFCYDVTRTECKQVETTADVEVCSFKYDRSEESAKAKTVEVEFEQDCKKQMVTVCQPTYSGQSIYQKCREVAQETCYNVPKLIEKEIDVTMGFPSAKSDCEIQTVTIPEIKCEDIVESKCQDIPHIVEEPETTENCQVIVGPPKCSEVELVLPKQVCQDIVYGYAEDAHEEYPAPQHEYGPPPPYEQAQPLLGGFDAGYEPLPAFSENQPRFQEPLRRRVKSSYPKL